MYVPMENSLCQSGKCLCHSQASLVLDTMVDEADGMQISEVSYPTASSPSPPIPPSVLPLNPRKEEY